MLCSKCNTLIDAGDKFCFKCGNLLLPETIRSHPVYAEADSIDNLHQNSADCAPTTSSKIEKSKIAELFEAFTSTYQGKLSKNIWTVENIPAKHIKNHTSRHLQINQNEKILVLLNKSSMFGIFTGIVITDQKIHYCTLRKNFFTGLIPWLLKGPKGCVEIRGLSSLEIAEHDACIGTAYVGHELRINGEIIGYVRMGTNILLDENAIFYLNSLFNFFADNSIIKQPVGIYKWQ